MLLPTVAVAALRLPNFFSDNMLIQRDGARIFGWAQPGAPVNVTVLVNSTVAAHTASIAATGDGRWNVSISLPATASSEVRIKTTRITTGETATTATTTVNLRNVAWGDLFLCSGQSNQAYPVADSFYGDAERAAATHPGLRLLTIAPLGTQRTNVTDVVSMAPDYMWAPSSPQALSPRNVSGGFRTATFFPSAVCYFAARDAIDAAAGQSHQKKFSRSFEY